MGGGVFVFGCFLAIFGDVRFRVLGLRSSFSLQPQSVVPSLSTSTLAESHTDMTISIKQHSLEQSLRYQKDILHRPKIFQTICLGETLTSLVNGET